MRHRDVPAPPALVGGALEAKREGPPAQTGPNIPVERTAHSARFVPVRESVGCGPPLTGGVRGCARGGRTERTQRQSRVAAPPRLPRVHCLRRLTRGQTAWSSQRAKAGRSVWTTLTRGVSAVVGWHRLVEPGTAGHGACGSALPTVGGCHCSRAWPPRGGLPRVALGSHGLRGGSVVHVGARCRCGSMGPGGRVGLHPCRWRPWARVGATPPGLRPACLLQVWGGLRAWSRCEAFRVLPRRGEARRATSEAGASDRGGQASRTVRGPGECAAGAVARSGLQSR